MWVNFREIINVKVLANLILLELRLGAYFPIRLIPLPEKNQVGNILVEYSPIKEISLNLELAASSYDRNSFSN